MKANAARYKPRRSTRMAQWQRDVEQFIKLEKQKQRASGEGVQQTLFGAGAVDVYKSTYRNCYICLLQAHNYPKEKIPHKPHSEECREWKAKQRADKKKSKQQKLKTTFSGWAKGDMNSERREAYFQPRQPVVTPAKEQGLQVCLPTEETPRAIEAVAGAHLALDPSIFLDCVKERCTPDLRDYMKKHHSDKHAPIPIVAVTELLVGFKEEELRKWLPLGSLEFKIPKLVPDMEKAMNPLYHSVVGQSIFIMDWERAFPGVEIPCIKEGCSGSMKKDPEGRSNFSKRQKKLFPLFRADGPPSWCVVWKYQCTKCFRSCEGNDGGFLLRLPAFVRNCYPVEPRYAGLSRRRESQIDKGISFLLEQLALTYANAEKVAAMIMENMRNRHAERAEEYFSFMKMRKAKAEASLAETSDPAEKSILMSALKKAQDFPSFYGEYLTVCPPAGDTLRDLFDEACGSRLHPYGVSDHERWTREIQMVKTSKFFAQDHTMAVTKNYQGNSGGKAVWTVCVEDGSVACAVNVDSTKHADVAHAAEQLKRRKGFDPILMYADTWPNKEEFWSLIFGPRLEGRLGLYHFMHRILKTLRNHHMDYSEAVKDLSAAIYQYDEGCYADLIKVLRNGTLGGAKLNEKEVNNLQNTPRFKKNYSKYLMKRIRKPEIIQQELEAWFCKYKCSSSDPDDNTARGRLDERTLKPLFTFETKDAVEQQKKHVGHIQDTESVERMYRKILPNPNGRSKHGLTEYISLRCESKLEGYHDPLANFANGATRASLADNLNLFGTARYNHKIRYKNWLAETPVEQRPALPVYWANRPSFFNDSRLCHINKIAEDVGAEIPFPEAQELAEDTGERFFSEYLNEERRRQKSILPHGANDRCQCTECAGNPILLHHDTRPVEIVQETERRSQIETLAEEILDESQQNDDETVSIAIAPPQQKKPKRVVPSPTQGTQRHDPLVQMQQGLQAYKRPSIPNQMVQMAQSPPFLFPNQIMVGNPYGFAPMMIHPLMNMNMHPFVQTGQDMLPSSRGKPQHQECCQKYIDYMKLPPSKRRRPPHNADCVNNPKNFRIEHV